MLKKLFKNRIFIFVLGIFICGTAGVYAVTYFPSNQVTYDNKTSGLKSSDVQGAIDELYSECANPTTVGDSILDSVPIITTGEGLYKDEYECRYFYRGANPNNYITFNGEEAGWRILSIECDGTIKIIRNKSIGNIAWDTSFNSWNYPSYLNGYLYSVYFNELMGDSQRQISAHSFSIGDTVYRNNDLNEQITQENSIQWSGLIALPTLSEYLRTNSNLNCNTFYLYNNNYESCKNTTWMDYGSEHLSTLTSETNADGFIFYIRGNGWGDIGHIQKNSSSNARPTLYLSSKIKITGGDGSQNKPFELSM